MPKVTIDIPSWLHNDMAKLFARGELCRSEGLATDCKINVDFLLAQLFHPYTAQAGDRQLALRQNGKTKQGHPHLEFIEQDYAQGAKTVLKLEISDALNVQAKAVAALRDQSPEQLAIDGLVCLVVHDRDQLAGTTVGKTPEES